MIPDTELQRWDDFLAAQGHIFEAAILKETGRPFVADELNVAFLQTDETLVAPEVEAAVLHFCRSVEWPPLNKKQALHLIHRAHCGRSVLQALLNRTLRADQIRIKIPDSRDNETFLQWLLIDCWKVSGHLYLSALTDAFLKAGKGNQDPRARLGIADEGRR